MSVEVEGNVIYHWFDAREDELEDIQSWTEAAAKIREVTDDVLRMAIALAPVGRARDDQFAQLKFSHYKGGTSFAGRHKYRQVVGNKARHAQWVHEGTIDMARFPVFGGQERMGPVFLGGGTGEVGLAPGPRGGADRFSYATGAQWVAYPSFVLFSRYLWKGQEAQPWLAEAGQAAFRAPGNH